MSRNAGLSSREPSTLKPNNPWLHCSPLFAGIKIFQEGDRKGIISRFVVQWRKHWFRVFTRPPQVHLCSFNCAPEGEKMDTWSHSLPAMEYRTCAALWWSAEGTTVAPGWNTTWRAGNQRGACLTAFHKRNVLPSFKHGAGSVLGRFGTWNSVI